MSQTPNSLKLNSDKNYKSPGKRNSQSRMNRLKEIDSIYKSQIQEIYSGSTKNNMKNQIQADNQQRSNLSKKTAQGCNSPIFITRSRTDDFQNISSASSRPLNSVLSAEKFRSSKATQGQSTRAIELLRKQSQNKEIKIRQLTSKCDYLLQKLKKHLNGSQYSQQVQSLNKLSENKIQRFQNLFKIKNQQLFFKIKLQIVSLLQEFQIPKQQLTLINEIQTESSLFSFMSKKLKSQLKTFRIKEQQNTFQIQKDKILNQKYQQRIHHLMETNQLMKLSENKLKGKNQDLKNQLSNFVEKIRSKQTIIQNSESELFRLKKQIQDVNSHNSKYLQLEKKHNQQKQAQKKSFEIKQKQMKGLLSNYSLEKQKLQKQLEQKQTYIQEILIKEKYLQQQNQRITRQMLRWKQRYQWIQKQLQQKQKQFQQQRQNILGDAQVYKMSNNQNILLEAKSQTEQALRRVEQYQVAYDRLLNQYDQQKKTTHLKHQEYMKNIERVQQQYMEKSKRVEKVREQQIIQIQNQYEERSQQMRRKFEKKEQMMAEQTQGRMKTILAQKDRKMTEKIIQMENQNQRLLKEIDSQKQLIYVLKGKNKNQDIGN